MKVNKWISGIHLHQYTTDKPDGTLMGCDADFGEMYALNGKLVSKKEYAEHDLRTISKKKKTKKSIHKTTS